MDVGKKFIAVCVMSGPAMGKPGSKSAASEPRRPNGNRRERGSPARDARTGSWRARAPTGSRCSICGKARCGCSGQSAGREGAPGAPDRPPGCLVAGPRWRHAMGTASWIPRRPQRERRDLTRRRRQLIQTASAEKNRLGKVVENGHGSWAACFRTFSGIRTTEAGSALGGPGGRCADRLFRQSPGEEKDSRPDRRTGRAPQDGSSPQDDPLPSGADALSGRATGGNRRTDPATDSCGWLHEARGVAAQPAGGSGKRRVLAEMGPAPAQFPDEKHLASWSGCVRATTAVPGVAKAATPTRETAGCVRL